MKFLFKIIKKIIFKILIILVIIGVILIALYYFGGTILDKLGLRKYNILSAKDVEPTCIEMGYTIWSCTSNSGTTSWIDDYVDALGHDFHYIDDEDTTMICTRCGYSLNKTDC